MERSIVIDADVHHGLQNKRDLLRHLPRVWHDEWLEMGAGVAGVFHSPVGVTRRDASPPNGGSSYGEPGFFIENLLDRYGIDIGILNAMIEISLYPDPDYANAVASAFNDYTAEFWLTYSPRFKGSIVINNADPAAAAAEIDRMAANPDMVQVVMTSASPKLYGQRFFHPIYEAAERNGLPVAIHPGGEGRGTAPAPTNAGYPTRYLEWHSILPTSYMAHINSLLCEGVFEKFPKLKFIAIEGGVAWLPHLMWRMDKNYKALRSSVPWLKRRPSEYILEHVRLTTQPIEEPDQAEELLHIFEMVAAERTLMFSSDYPHWDFDNPLAALPKMPKQLKRRIMGETAAELYRLTLPGSLERRYEAEGGP